MGLIQEFKEFAVKGNVLDLAVAVVIGTAFGKIVDSVVKDIITPILTPAQGAVDFASLKVGPFAIGNFINNVISFIIVAFVLFIIVKAANRFKKPVEETVDLAAVNAEQNRKIIELLEKIAAK
jgi:large conductance mechanosensitive channel